VPNIVSFAASIAELAHRENRIVSQSLNHSPSLFDAPGTKALALQNCHKDLTTMHPEAIIWLETHFLKNSQMFLNTFGRMSLT